jgi:hypothetical protein
METIAVQSATPWVPLAKLGAQFQANLAMLRKRDPDLADQLAKFKPTAQYLLRTQADTLILARRAAASGEVQTLTNPVSSTQAREIAAKIFPDGRYSQPLLVAGLDQGWLWDALYKLPCACSHAPGMRFPLYLLASSIERLWVVLHYQNWNELLADTRVRIIAGPGAADDFQASLLSAPTLCIPRMAVTVEPQLWKEGQNLDALVQVVTAAHASRLAELQRRLAAEAVPGLPGGSLRILGITSRYTTFLQHSMRDWLAAMETMGHQTRLLIEQADHETMPALVMAEQCLSFRPDLILVIDHYRAEMPGLPRHVPCVMWIQDRLPNIYNSAAGAQQEANDYVIGYGRQECARKWGYPPRRFMPTSIGVNEQRFAPRELTRAEIAQYACVGPR